MDAVLTALVEDRIGPGEQARQLIQIAREKLEFDSCIALRSPAIALFYTLKSLGLEAGQGVILSALSPLYYLNVLNDLKLQPVYADVPQGGVNISKETIEKAIEQKPEGCEIRAVLLHHTLGYISDISVSELGIPIIEDCSCSYGSMYRAQANSGIFSILGLEERDMLTAGCGALLYTANRRDSALLRNTQFSNLPPEYGLPDMNASMAIAQFRSAAKNLEKRREIAAAYSQSAGRTRHKRFIHEVTDTESGEGYNNYAFPLILETGMKDVKAYARRKDIIVESAFENTLMGLGIVPAEKCPESYSLSLRTVLFPLYPRLRTEEINKVAKLILTLP